MSKKQKKPMRSFDESVRAGTPAFVADALRRSLGGIGAAIKKPLVLLPAVVLLLVQTALSIVKIEAPASVPIRILSLLTFAQGGMYAGFLGKVGGVLGKTLLAGMVTKLFIKNKGQKPPKAEKIKGGSFGLLVAGLGAGLVAYNFLTGNACLENAMIGVTSAMAVYRTAGRPDAFLPGLLRSFRKGKTPAGAAKSALQGGGTGLVLGVLSSLRGSGYLCYVLGGALLLLGLVLTMLKKNKRTVAAAAVLIICLSPLAGLSAPVQAASPSQGYWKRTSYYIVPADQTQWNSVVEGKPTEELNKTIAYTSNLVGEYWELTRTITHAGIAPENEAQSLVDYVLNKKGQASTGDYFGCRGDCGGSVYNKASFNILPEELYPGESIVLSMSLTSQASGCFVDDGDVEAGFWGGDLLFESDPSGHLNTSYSDNKMSDQCRKEVVVKSGSPGASDYFIQDVTFGRGFTVNYSYEWQNGTGSRPSAAGTWQLESKIYHGEAGCIRTLDCPVVFDTVGNSTGMGWKFTAETGTEVLSNVAIYDYPEEIASGDTLSIRLALVSHHASFSCAWAGIDNCGMEQESFTPRDIRDLLYGWLPSQGKLPQIPLETADGNNVICTWWPSFGTPDNYAEFTDRAEVFSTVMPDGTAFSGRCSVYVGLTHTTEPGVRTPMVEFVYQWVPVGAALPPEGEGEGLFGGLFDGDLFDLEGLFDEDGFFDGENWIAWDEEYEHSDIDDTVATDTAAALGGFLAALLAAGGALGGGFGAIPPLPNSPFMQRDPDDPSYAMLTGPGGEQSLYHYDEASGLWRDPYSDSYLEPGEIGRAMEEARDDRGFSKSVIGQMQDRTDAASERQKQLFKMEQQEERLWKQGGGYDWQLESRLADQLKKLRGQMMSGYDLDVAQYEKVRNAIGKLSRGEMKNESLANMPPDDRWSPGEIKTAMELTGREIGTSSSWKAWALRGALAVATGGASERGFDLTDALYTMHDSYMAGDSEGKAIAKAVGTYVAGELAGEVAKAGLKKVGGAIADTNAGKKTLNYVKDLMDPAAKQADDAAMAAKRLAMVKQAPATEVGTAPKLKTGKLTGDGAPAPKPAAKPQVELEPPKPAAKPQVELEPPKRKAKAPFDSLQDDKRIASLKEKAQADIQKKLDDLRAKQGTDPLQAAANNRAAAKVDKLQKALDDLRSDPANPAKRKAAEEAAMSVQQDKAGIRQMKQAADVPPESRQIFNAMKTQKDQIATANTREILAKKFGVNPNQVKSIEPSNTMTTSQLRQVGEADGIFKTAPTGDTQGAKRFTEKDFPLDTANASKTGVSSDIDKTMRIEVEELDPRTGQTVLKKYDIPSGEVKSVYEEEFYRSWHGGEIPTKTVDGATVPDTEAIQRFAKEMDVSCNDKYSTESYSDLVEAMKKSGVKDFSDVQGTSLTTAHKSIEWFRRAEILEKNAGGDLDILSQAENLRTEGIRQATKQFENLTMRQAREINLAKHIERVKVPDSLIERMEVLKRVDQVPPNGISTSEAEAILKQMGTSTERTLEQFQAVTEMLNKWM